MPLWPRWLTGWCRVSELQDVRLDDLEPARYDPDQITDLLNAVNHAQREVEHERRLRIAAEESRTRVPFKVGGYGMFNRPDRWEADSRSSLPDWFKVASYCHTHHGKDGHCHIEGEFGATILGKPVKPPNVTRLIRRAVDEGQLAEGSNPRCLVAPYFSRYMTTGDVWSDCDRH